MKDDEFEWDAVKAAQNLANHGVSFEAARLAFDDPFAVIRETGVKITARVAMSCSAWSKTTSLPSSTHSAARGFGSFRPAWRNHGNDGAIMKRTGKGKRKIDWSRADAMTEAERHAAAMADPDARPMTDEQWARARRVPRVSVIRRALKLSQEQFAATFHIPIGTVRDWEQGRYEPDAAARAYLRVIAREPNTVRKALAARTKPRL